MSGTLPVWLERWFGIEAAGRGEGTAWELSHSWPIAPWLTVVLLAAAAGVIVYCYLHETGTAARRYRLGLATLRLLLVATVLFMVAGFVLSLERTGLPYLLLLVDDSASMAIVDRYDDESLRESLRERVESVGLTEPTRLALAKAVLLDDDAALLRDLGRRHKLKAYFVASGVRPQTADLDELIERIRTLEPTGQSSRLGTAVRTVLDDMRGTPPSAIVLMTDGINTEGESLAEAAALARRKGVPLFTLGLGDDKPQRDLRLSELLVDEVVFVDDVVNFEFNVTATGFEGRRVTVILRTEETQEPLAQVEVTLGPDGIPQKVRLPYRPRTEGDVAFVVEVGEQPEELQADNNRLERTVSVRKDQIRVLLVQAAPNWEFRRLKDVLRRDPTIEVDTVLQQADLEYTETDSTARRVFPVRREELFAYDVVIFGDVDPSFLSQSAMTDLAAFVTEKGGGLIVVAGPRFTPLEYRDTPLAELMPIDYSSLAGPARGTDSTDGFQMRPTALGLAAPAMQLADDPRDTEQLWRGLPPLYWFFEAPRLKPAARVLAEHPVRLGPGGEPIPLIAMQYVGAGKVLYHATDETWRWRFRIGDVLFARYWVQSIRYLSRSKLLGKDRSALLTVDRREYQQGELVRFRVRFVDERSAPSADDGVTLMIERNGDKKQPLVLRRSAASRGVFDGVLSQLAEGRYHAWIAAPLLKDEADAADFEVAAPLGERRQIEADTAALRQASHESQGRFYRMSDAAEIAGDLPRGRQIPIEALPPVVLWNQWPVVLWFLGLVVTEWVMRKRKGML